MRYRMFWLLSCLTLLSLLVSPAQAQAPAAAEKAISWVRTQQQPNGSFAGIGAGSTADALYALAAAGVNTDAVAVGGVSAQTFIEKNAAEIAAKPGLAAKFVLAELLTGHNPRNVAGVDLVAAVTRSVDPVSGLYGPDISTHGLSIIALVAAGEKLHERAISSLIERQQANGSWSFNGGPTDGDTNTTALVIQSLVAGGQKDSPAVEKALTYLVSQRNADGGFPYSQQSAFGTATDANSTALVIQAIVATGGNPTGAPWADAAGNPLGALLQLQNASGAFRYDAATPEDNAFATYQAVPAILLKPFPAQQIAIVQQPTSAPAPTVAPAPPAPAPTAAPAPGVPVALPDTGGESAPTLWIVLAGVGAALLGLRLRQRLA